MKLPIRLLLGPWGHSPSCLDADNKIIDHKEIVSALNSSGYVSSAEPTAAMIDAGLEVLKKSDYGAEVQFETYKSIMRRAFQAMIAARDISGRTP